MEVQEICELTGADEAAVIAVIEIFRREGRSFLMPPPTDALTGAPIHLNRESLIDISHESLIRNWERLKTWLERALKLCHEICKEKEDEAKMLISVGKQVDGLVGDERAAIGYFEQAVQIHRERGDKAAETQALTEISQSFEDRCKLGLENPAAQPNPKAKCERAIQYLKLTQNCSA